MKPWIAGSVALMAVAMSGCMRRLLGITRPNLVPIYRLVDCTPAGAKALANEFTNKVASYGSSQSGDGPTMYYVSPGEWSQCKEILHKLEKAHPKDFSNEATRPVERFSELP